MKQRWIDDINVWMVAGPDPARPDGGDADRPGEVLRAILFGRYGREGANGSTFTIVRGYSGEVLGRAGGGGYDRQGAALADALLVLFPYIGRFDGAAGVSSVIAHAARYGVAVFTLADALYRVTDGV